VQKGVISVIAAAAAVAAFWPGAGSAATATGIVVAKDHGIVLVASPSGALQAVRAHAAIGSRLAGTTVVGHATRAHITGVLVRRLGRTLVLSSNHHLIAVPNRVGRALAAVAVAPASGAVVAADVSIRNGEIEAEDEDDVGQAAGNTIAVQATVKAVGAGTVTLDVQGQSITVSLPGGLTLPASLVGQTVSLNLALRGDDNAAGDDDDTGDDHGGDGHGGGDHSGHGRGGDDG
jgi:hypothetical protein